MSHFEGKVRVQAILEHDGKILLVRDHKDKDAWDLPGGRVNNGETIEQTVVREVEEELGIACMFTSFITSEQSYHHIDNKNSLFITCSILSDDIEHLHIPSEEVAEVRWIQQGEEDSLQMYESARHPLKIFWQ